MSSATLPPISELTPEQYKQLFKQSCSVGCVAGLMVAAAIIAILCSGLMCFLFWPGMELVSRQEKRIGAHKRIHERNAAREEKRLQDEQFDEEA